LYDPKTWQLQTYRAGPRREEKPCDRPKGVVPLCETDQGCPKGSPKEEPDCLLLPKNRATLRLYLEARTLGGRLMTKAERRDLLLRHNLAVVDRLYRQWEREHEAKLLGIEVANQVAALMV
jgi:hypothetical protein